MPFYALRPQSVNGCMETRETLPKRPDLDGDARRTAYDRYGRELLIYARRRVGAGPPDPEDLVQQAFANFSGLVDPRKIREPRAFLYRTLANLITDYRKSGHHQRSVNITDEERAVLPELEDPVSPEIALLDRERFLLVSAAIRALPRRQRRFLILNRFDGLSYAEIARRNLVSETTARREVEIAIRACSRALEDGGGAR